jgi:hypothetical protein
MILAKESLPQPLVDAILIRDRLIKVAVFAPSPGDIAEVALADGTLGQAGAPDQGFNGDGVEAFAFGLRPPAQLQVNDRRNFSESVLHA